MTYSKTIPYILIAILLVGIFFLRECSPDPKPCPPTVVVTHTDTIHVPVNIPFPVPFPVNHIDTFTLPADVDTVAILKDYYALNTYNRTILDDSTGHLIIHDSVTHNRLKRYSLSGHINMIVHTITITNDITKPIRNRVFFGMQIGSNLNSLMLLPTATLFTKKDKTLYSIGYDPFSKVGYIGVQFKIILKK
jgi:hypothetical protein